MEQNLFTCEKISNGRKRLLQSFVATEIVLVKIYILGVFFSLLSPLQAAIEEIVRLIPSEVSALELEN